MVTGVSGRRKPKKKKVGKKRRKTLPKEAREESRCRLEHFPCGHWQLATMKSREIPNQEKMEPKMRLEKGGVGSADSVPITARPALTPPSIREAEKAKNDGGGGDNDNHGVRSALPLYYNSFLLTSYIVIFHGCSLVPAMSNEGDRGATAECPSVPWRLLSQATLIGVGALCRGFLFGLSNPEINGLESFLEVLEERRDPTQRSRGLLTGG